MIESLFFFITACMAATVGYSCNIDIEIIETQEGIIEMWTQETGKPYDDENKYLRGFHFYLPVYDVHVIKILNGTDGLYSAYGCTVLWHELLHARGITDKDIPLCLWKNNVSLYSWWNP